MIWFVVSVVGAYLGWQLAALDVWAWTKGSRLRRRVRVRFVVEALVAVAGLASTALALGWVASHG